MQQPKNNEINQLLLLHFTLLIQAYIYIKNMGSWNLILFSKVNNVIW